MKQVIYKTIKELVNNQDIQIIDGDRGKNYPKKEEFKSIGFCVFLNASNIKDDTFVFENIDFISEEKDNLLRKGKLSRNDIVITTRGTVGLVAYYGDNIPYDNMRINSGMIIIRVNSNVINPNYFYQLLKSKSLKKQYQLFASGCAQPQLPIQDFRLISIPVFTKTHQDKIAKILSNYDDLIENNNKRIKILEELAQKIYKEWFVDLKFPGYETTTFKQTNLGKIPSDWKIDLANQIAEIYIGRTPSRKDFECFTTCKKDKKWVSIKDIGHSNEYIFDTSEYLTENAIKKYNVPLIPKDTIILSFKLTVGKVTITTEEMTSNEAIAQFQIKDKELIPTNYLFLYLKNFEYNNLGNTSSIGNAINSTIVKNMPIIVPDKGFVQKFDKTVINIFNQIKNLSQQNINLKQARDILLPRLISGEIDVENLEIL